MQKPDHDPGTGIRWIDKFNGDEHPITLGEWRERQRAEFVTMRARAHAELDAHLDQMEQRMVLDFERIDRDLHNLTQH